MSGTGCVTINTMLEADGVSTGLHQGRARRRRRGQVISKQMKDLEQRRRCSADSQALSGGLTSPDISPLCSRNLSPRAIECARQWRRDRQRRRWRLRHVRQRHRRKKRRRHRQKRLPRAPVGLGHEEPLPAPPHPHSLSRLGASLASASPSTHLQKQLPRRVYTQCRTTPATNRYLLQFFPQYFFKNKEGRAHQSCSSHDSHLHRSTHILHCKLHKGRQPRAATKNGNFACAPVNNLQAITIAGSGSITCFSCPTPPGLHLTDLALRRAYRSD